MANEEIGQVTVFKYLGRLGREDIRCSQEVKYRTALSKEALNRKKRLLFRPLDVKPRMRMVKCFVWSDMGEKREHSAAQRHLGALSLILI